MKLNRVPLIRVRLTETVGGFGCRSKNAWSIESSDKLSQLFYLPDLHVVMILDGEKAEPLWVPREKVVQMSPDLAKWMAEMDGKEPNDQLQAQPPRGARGRAGQAAIPAE